MCVPTQTKDISWLPWVRTQRPHWPSRPPAQSGMDGLNISRQDATGSITGTHKVHICIWGPALGIPPSLRMSLAPLHPPWAAPLSSLLPGGIVATSLAALPPRSLRAVPQQQRGHAVVVILSQCRSRQPASFAHVGSLQQPRTGAPILAMSFAAHIHVICGTSTLHDGGGRAKRGRRVGSCCAQVLHTVPGTWGVPRPAGVVDNHVVRCG